MPLTFPRAATAQIALPAQLEGKTLVEDKRAHTVVAEMYKAKGAAVRIAVAPGEYDVIVRHGRELSHCELDQAGEVQLDRCRTETIAEGTAKGGGWLQPRRLELAGIIGPERSDAYTQSLNNFGYHENGIAAGLALVGLQRVTQRLWLGIAGTAAGMPEWRDTISGTAQHQTLDWSIETFEAVVRGEEPIREGGRAKLFAQLSGGLGIGHTNLTDAMGTQFHDTYFGPAFGFAAGLHIDARHGIGFTTGYAFDYAPVIHDLINNTHASGGSRLTFAVTYGF